MAPASGFLKVVNEARPYVDEIDIEAARQRLKQEPTAVLVDVREDAEWEAGHAAGAVHLGRGVLERDIEELFPDSDRELIMYCGGGSRSVLAAATAQRMGYTKVRSLRGGYKALVQANWPMAKGQ